ncbi:unnamed protein product [Discosporangium mesarthrocarpum]
MDGEPEGRQIGVGNIEETNQAAQLSNGLNDFLENLEALVEMGGDGLALVEMNRDDQIALRAQLNSPTDFRESGMDIILQFPVTNIGDDGGTSNFRQGSLRVLEDSQEHFFCILPRPFPPRHPEGDHGNGAPSPGTELTDQSRQPQPLDSQDSVSSSEEEGREQIDH